MNVESDTLDYKPVSHEWHAILSHEIIQHMKDYLSYARHKTWWGFYKHELTMYSIDKSVASKFTIAADSHSGECKITYKYKDHPMGELSYNLESGKPLAVNFMAMNGTRMYPHDEKFLNAIRGHSIILRDGCATKIGLIIFKAMIRKFISIFMDESLRRIIGGVLSLLGLLIVYVTFVGA